MREDLMRDDMMKDLKSLPVAVIGAGPSGLAAAAHLAARGVPARLYEAGEAAAAHVRDWGHVKLFSPWRECIDPAARAALEAAGWTAPDPDALPTGAELYEGYLRPLTELPGIAAISDYGARVTGLSRLGIDKAVSKEREGRPFVIEIASAHGSRRELARAVIDASGTWRNPNPLGGDGLAAHGERDAAERIAYGIPDILGRERTRFSGKSVLVVGAGHSAANVLLDLARLAEEDRRLAIVWAVRRGDPTRLYGGGVADQLPGRAALGAGVRRLVEEGRLTLVTGFSATRVRLSRDGVAVDGETPASQRRLGPFDRIVVATGQRPDLTMTRELRLDIDPALESARALAPLIDPNVHSCGTVPPHGHRALAHPEPGFYTVGVKSYGRAPNFLMLTGYEQVRSVVAALAGDLAAADDVRLTLPETGVCSGFSGAPTRKGAARPVASASCCGGPAPAEVDACCVADAVAKSEGASGCGCGTAEPARGEKARERELV